MARSERERELPSPVREQIINPSTELTMENILDNCVVQLQQKVRLTYLNVAFRPTALRELVSASASCIQAKVNYIMINSGL